MPTAPSIATLQTLEVYNDLIYGLQNFNRWGIKIQSLAATLQAEANYTTIFTTQERTALTNFLNSINSIIPINNIPDPIS